MNQSGCFPIIIVDALQSQCEHVHIEITQRTVKSTLCLTGNLYIPDIKPHKVQLGPYVYLLAEAGWRSVGW